MQVTQAPTQKKKKKFSNHQPYKISNLCKLVMRGRGERYQRVQVTKTSGHFVSVILTIKTTTTQ
jgi:hypothetical protein